MAKSPSPGSTSRPSGPPFDALAPLTFPGWGYGLALIVAGMAASFLLYGYEVVYWRNADMDFMVIYNALVMNDGKPQHFFDHTAYLTIISVKAWFEVLHHAGLLDSHSLSSLPPATDQHAFDTAMTSLVRVGRVMAWLIATGFALIFASLVRAIVRDWRIALLATFAFAFSGGMAVHDRILRSELVAACPVIFALMILIMTGRRASAVRPLWMMLAASLCVLGLENKVQVILLIAALPILILPFGSQQSASVAFWSKGRLALPLVLFSGVAAGVAIWAASPLISTGLDRTLLDAAGFRPLLLDHFGVYQAGLIILTSGCMIAYALMWRISINETLASMAAMAAGASVALLALNLDYNTNNVIAVINPLEKILTFADPGMVAAGKSGVGDIVGLLLADIASVVARYSFILHPSPRPTVFITWLIVPGIIHAWRQGERLVAVQALLLLAAATGIDTLGIRRGLKSEYFIFTDPLIILAGTLLLERLTELRFHRWAYPVAVVLFGLQILIGQAEPVKYALMRRGPEPVCEWSAHYLPLLALPWCPKMRS